MAVRESGYLYVRNLTEGMVDFPDTNLNSGYCSGFESSDVDGKLGWLKLPATGRWLNIPAGVALRVPTALGARLSAMPSCKEIDADEFYRRGETPPDGYALLDELKDARRKLSEAKRAAKKVEAAPEPVPEAPKEE